MTLKAIIFDVDGTVAETADAKRAAFNQAFAELGLDWVWNRPIYAQIAATTRPGKEAEGFAWLRHRDLVDRFTRTGLFHDIRRKQRRHYLNLLEAGAAPLRQGVARLIGEILTQRVRLVLKANGRAEDFETLLFNRFGPEIFDDIHPVVAQGTPGPEADLALYSKCLSAAEARADQVVAIEDSGVGVQAATRLVIPTIATPSLYCARDNFTGARAVLSDLGHPAAPFRLISGADPGIGHVTVASLAFWQGSDAQQAAA